jgi:CubicO group peptidase (beta-lactamase class C family)
MHSLRASCAVLLLVGCHEDPGAATPDAVGADAAAGELCSQVEARMRATLDAAATDASITTVADFTVLLEAADGRRFSHSHGTSTATTRYESASTSKWVTAAVVLELVDRGTLALDTKAHDKIAFWQETTVTLRDLLSFTSGFSDEPLCINGPNIDFRTCVQAIYDNNATTAAPAGTEFHYASTHLQVAGLMAMNASGVASWTAVFDAWRARKQLFATGAYDLPSATNPRLAGGMHWTGEEYLAFLRALYHGTLLSATSTAAMLANQRGSASVTYSPTIPGALGEDWAYGLGNWLECPTAKTVGSFNCGAGHRNSSPGAYGAYPFIDFDHEYFGIIARQGGLGTYPEGVRLFRTIETDAAIWADRRCR